MPIAEPRHSAPAAFDGHRPPDPDLIADCVHCGFCLPTCPTYALWGEEMDSPRGRIYLMKMVSEGGARLNDTVVPHFDRCLGCMACVTACPSGVQYDKLIEATRAQVERNYPRSQADRLFRRMLFELFPYPKRLRAALLGVILSERLGLRSLLRGTGLLDMLSGRVDAMESILPKLRDRNLEPVLLRSRMRPKGPARRRVGLITGCVQQVLFGEVNAATARVLLAEGCEVIVPTEQGCCGALELHAGEEARTLGRARKLIALFERARVDTVVINAAGCGSSLKEYGYLLRDDPAWARRAAAFSERIRDVSEILAELEPRAVYHPLPFAIAYHDACHLRHAQGVYVQPRLVLSRIPNLEIREIAESELCCGSAGIYNLVQPEPARELGDRKAQNIGATGAQAVATGNPGCLLQISSALDRCGRSLPVVHPVELLDASIRGVVPKALQ